MATTEGGTASQSATKTFYPDDFNFGVNVAQAEKSIRLGKNNREERKIPFFHIIFSTIEIPFPFISGKK